MEQIMNMKVKILGLVLATAAISFAADPAAEAPAAEPAAAVADSNAVAPAAEPAPDVAAAPESSQDSSAAPAEAPVDSASAPAEAAPEETAAAPAEQPAEPAPADVGEAPAPMAVRGVDPAAQPVSEPEYTVRETKVYRLKSDPIPMKFTFGAQAILGTNSLFANNWDLNESYSGVAWKAGLFALLPLNDYTMGFRIGVMYDYSDASATYFYGSDLSKEAYVKFKMGRISVPLLFVLKSAYSHFSFDFGAQVSIPVLDDFKYHYVNSRGEDVDGIANMIDQDYRTTMDFSLLLGLTIKANRYMSFDIRYEFGFSNFYENVPGWRINELTSSTFLLGLSFYVL